VPLWWSQPVSSTRWYRGSILGECLVKAGCRPRSCHLTCSRLLCAQGHLNISRRIYGRAPALLLRRSLFRHGYSTWDELHIRDATFNSSSLFGVPMSSGILYLDPTSWSYILTISYRHCKTSNSDSRTRVAVISANPQPPNKKSRKRQRSQPQY